MIGRVVLRMRSGTDPGTQVPFVTGAPRRFRLCHMSLPSQYEKCHEIIP